MPTDQDLSALRSEIDAIDDAILDLMERRLALARQTAVAKAGDGHLHIRPRREAAILARLRGNADLADPIVVETIWRELIGESRQAQAPLGLVLCTAGDRPAFEAQARRHFGSATPVRWTEDSEEALRLARDEALVAVVPHRPKDLPDGLIVFDKLRDLDGNIVACAIGRVLPDDAP